MYNQAGYDSASEHGVELFITAISQKQLMTGKSLLNSERGTVKGPERRNMFEDVEGS